MKPKDSELLAGIDLPRGASLRSLPDAVSDGIRIVYLETPSDGLPLPAGGGAELGLIHRFRTGTGDAAAQAGHFCDTVKHAGCGCIPAVAAETEETDGSEQTAAALITFCEAFLSLFGHAPLLLATPSFIGRVCGTSFARYGLWIAQYGVDEPGDNAVWSRWDAWQRNRFGHVRGVEGEIHLDVFTSDILLTGCGAYPGSSFFSGGEAGTCVCRVRRALTGRGFSAHPPDKSHLVWGAPDRMNYREWQLALGYPDEEASGIPDRASFDILDADRPVIPAYPGREFFRPGTESAFARFCGDALIKAGCGVYQRGPSFVWQQADRRGYRLFQKKIGDPTVDGIPGPKGWALLQAYMQ